MTFSIRYGHFHSPMRFNFKHASADRTETQNVIVALSDGEGRIGYGEGCPRHYVTGETSQSAFSFLQKNGEEIAQATTTLETLKAWMKANEGLIDENPSAFCAIELAALDLLAKRQNLGLETLLSLPILQKPVAYTAVMGDSSRKKTRVMSWAYRLYGFSDFKLKLSGDFSRDQQRLATLPQSATLRLDANNFWHDAEACIAYCERLKRPFWAIEEPVQAFDIDAMLVIANALNIRIILDESCLREEHIAPYARNAEHFAANIRVSKCGGLIRSIGLAEHCSSLGIDVVLGAHVAETSLLTRAALAVGQSLQREPLAREGAYGKILLKQDVAAPSLRFGWNGILQPDKYHLPSKSGFGIAVNPELVEWSNS